MSFSTQAKDELARIYPKEECCRLAELAAIVRMNGSLSITGQRHIDVHIRTENAAVARKIFRLTKQLFPLEVEILVQRRTKLKKRNIYDIKLASHPQMVECLERLGIFGDRMMIFSGIKPVLISRQCCRRSFLRGIFLGAGSVSNPEGHYHLEIIVNDLDYAHSLVDVINSFPMLQAKVSSRKKWHVIYLKESEQIIAFLSIIGAHQALLSFENTRIVKGVRNEVNRIVNCETANLNKTVNASLRQIENIKLLDELVGLDKLPRRLRDIAVLRRNNPDVSLKELGEMMEPPIGKSGVNHRMRKIEEYADELRGRLGKMRK